MRKIQLHKNTSDNNSINSHAQDTTELQSKNTSDNNSINSHAQGTTEIQPSNTTDNILLAIKHLTAPLLPDKPQSSSQPQAE